MKKPISPGTKDWMSFKAIPNQKSLYENFATIYPIIIEMKIKINEPIFEKKEDRIEKGRTKSIKPTNI